MTRHSRLQRKKKNNEKGNPEQVSTILDGDFGIPARAGVHCAPLVHEDLGTSLQAGVWFSLGCFNSIEEINEVVEAMSSISQFQWVTQTPLDTLTTLWEVAPLLVCSRA